MIDTTTPSNAVQHPLSVDAYLKNGLKLVPIPPATKGPQHKGWNLPENTLQSAADLPQSWGIGLAHAYSGTMALDIDDWDRAKIEFVKFGINIDDLFDAADAVEIDSGKPGHGKLIFRMPAGIPMQSKKLIDVREDGTKYNYIDFRCASSNGSTMQDVMPPSIHPDTMQPYRWAGKGNWQNIPNLPEKLQAMWQHFIDQETTFSNIESKDYTSDDINFEEVYYALQAIHPSCEYDEWYRIGMGLKWAGLQINQEEKAFKLWDHWSSGSEDKYTNTDELLKKWKSFRVDGTITLGTVYKYAFENGWDKPTPDASVLFESVEQQETVDVRTMLFPDPPALNLNLIPQVLRDRAMEVSESVGCDPLVPLFAGLAVASGCADARTRLELTPGFEVPPIIWVMTIGAPANKKTPGATPMFTPVKAIEKEHRPQFKQEMLAWEAIQAAHESSKKDFIDYHKNPENHLDNDAGPAVLELPPPPVPVKIIIKDSTSQKLVHLAADRDRGMLCHMDEMNGWMKKVTAKNGGEDRSTWVQAFEGNDYSMDRVGAGSIWVENFALSIYGNVQPQALKHHASELSKDGLIQRFIMVPLRLEYTRVVNTDVPHSAYAESWEMAMRNLYSMPAVKYQLSYDANQSFIDFLHWSDHVRKTEHKLKADEVYQGMLGKMDGYVGRLILMWHLLMDPYNPEVNKDTAEMAIDFYKTYIMGTLEYAVDQIAGYGFESVEYWIVQHVLQFSDTGHMTLSNIKRSAKRQWTKHQIDNDFTKNNIIRDTMATLEQANWVQLVKDSNKSVEWAINPALPEQYKDFRNEVINAKQAKLDIARDIANKSNRKLKHVQKRYTHGAEELE